MAVQGEVPLFTKDVDGKIVPFVCESCGRQRIGLNLNIITRTMLPCVCEKQKSKP